MFGRELFANITPVTHNLSMRSRTVWSTIVFLAAATWSGAGCGGIVEQRTLFGLVALVQETRTPALNEPAIMHVATEWTKLHLRWAASAGDMTLSLIDNGGMLEIETHGHGCSSNASHQRYGKQVGEDALWIQMNETMGHMLKHCPRITAEQAKAYRRELARAQNDYIAGIEAMKVRAGLIFGAPLTRCRPPKELVLAEPFASRCDGVW